jgi:cardiolipin synthase
MQAVNAEQTALSQTKKPAPIRATVEGNQLDLIETGAGRIEAILQLIRGAKRSVRLLYYIFGIDASSIAVRDALVEAAQRGVRVSLILDGFGSAYADAKFFQPFSDSGGQLCLFNPKYGRRYLLRNHQKLIVVDEQKAMIGGANIEDNYLTDEGPRHWRDLALVIDGPIVAAAADYFDALYRWTGRKGTKLLSLRRLVARHSDRRGLLQWHFSAPLSLRTPWPLGFARDLYEATNVDLIAPYFTPPRSMLRRVTRVASRGRVRLIAAGKSDIGATLAAARHSYSRLLRRGVEVYEYQPARLHTKLAIMDGAVHIGSANFDFRSLYINLEIMLRVEDPAFTAAMRAYFDREVADSEHITPELHRKRANPWRRLKWFIAHWLVTSLDYNLTRRLNLPLEK